MKWLIGLAALVLACAVLVRVLGNGDDTAATTGRGSTPAGNGVSTAAPQASSTTSATSAPAGVTQPPPRRPELPALSTAPKNTAGEQFVAEARDNHWAAVTESTLRDKLGALRDVRVAAPECHDTLCKLSITGPSDAIGRAIAQLESKRGLAGVAQSWILSAPETAGDGSLSLVAYARFSRDAVQ